MASGRWYKGNTHTHTTYSDGDSEPEVVVDWYANQGYDFVFLTDHNAVVPADHIARLQRRGLAVFQGEEITMDAVHVNGLGLARTLLPDEPASGLAEPYVNVSRATRVRWAVERITAEHGLATVNHPFFGGLTAEDLLDSGEFDVFEVANGNHPEGHRALGSEGWTDALWDRLLTAGRRLVAVASDDAHHFRNWGPRWANPGRGWVQVEADSPRLTDCLEALRRGNFYASTGLELCEYRVESGRIVVELDGEEANIELVGAGGRVLDSVRGTSARFKVRGSSGPYVRMRATSDDRRQVWAQPVHF